MTPCDLCAEYVFAWRNLPITSDDRWQIWRHFRECEEALREYALAKKQIDEMEASDESMRD